MFFSKLQIYKDSQFNDTKIKNSKIQLQNKAQTLRKSYTSLTQSYTNLNNNNNIDNDNNNNYIYIKNKIERKKREKKKIMDIYLRHKGIQ